MTFLYPSALWLLLLLPLVYVVYRWSAARHHQLLNTFLEQRHWKNLVHGVSWRRYWLKFSLLLMGVGFAILALARPSWGQREQILVERGLDIVIALDVSRSMQAEDVSPNRFENAKSRIRELMAAIPGHRIGLMPFAGDAYLVAPITSDYNFVRKQLESLNTRSSIRTPGSNFVRVVDVARFAFTQGAVGKKVLIFVSDGEDHSQELDRVVQNAQQEGILIFSLGIGTEEGIQLPFPSIDPQTGTSTAITSKLNTSALQKMADATGGSAYVAPAGAQLDVRPLALELEQLSLDANERNEATRLIREDRFQIPLLIAFLLLVIETIISSSARQKSATLKREVLQTP
ncbi:MAG: VWA domain-containing protein [Candidatus Sumerlaeia bacterium]|nr:VWA domain-containing protein [Candidatus Sumerlaeia bacterium]